MGSSADKFKPPPRFGNYDVREALGEGGMAMVFRAEHVMLQRAAAIKFLHADLMTSDAARARFLREARVVAKLAHPNVVSIFDFGVTDDGLYYLASELVEGQTLREFTRGRRLESWRALRFARQIAAGLSSAHEAGVIHRDLKPSNVMVMADKTAAEGSRLKVLDFGIAKSVTSPPGSDLEVTAVGHVVGTPGYMSPEQCRADADIGPATDIYSLGVVLYGMLCGQPPFYAAHPLQLAEMHISVPPPVPSVICACSPAVDDLVLRMLAKAPRDRPASMDDVITQIDFALNDTATAAGTGDVEPPRSTEELDHGLAEGTMPTESSHIETLAVESSLPPPPRRRFGWMTIALAGLCVAGAGVLAALAWPSSSHGPVSGEAASSSVTEPAVTATGTVPTDKSSASPAAGGVVDPAAGRTEGSSSNDRGSSGPTAETGSATKTETEAETPSTTTGSAATQTTPDLTPPTTAPSTPAAATTTPSTTSKVTTGPTKRPARKLVRPKRKPAAGSAEEPDYSFEKPID